MYETTKLLPFLVTSTYTCFALYHHHFLFIDRLSCLQRHEFPFITFQSTRYSKWLKFCVISPIVAEPLILWGGLPDWPCLVSASSDGRFVVHKMCVLQTCFSLTWSKRGVWKLPFSMSSLPLLLLSKLVTFISSEEGTSRWLFLLLSALPFFDGAQT